MANVAPVANAKSYASRLPKGGTPADLYPLLEHFKQRFFCADSMKWCISGTWCTDPLPTRGRIRRTNDRERPQRAREQRPAERSRERAGKAPCAHPTVTKGTTERNSAQISRKRGIHSRKVCNVPTDTRQNLAMPRTFHCVIYLLRSIRNHSVSQRAFASRHGGKAHGFALYGRHRVAGKREGCVLSSAKINDTFRIIAISSREISVFFEEKEQSAKTCGLFLDSSLVWCFSSLVSAESRDPFPHSPPAALLARVDTLANGHAPAHRALNDFAFLAFTLHLHT